MSAGALKPWVDVFTNISTARWRDAVLGLVCSAVLLSLRTLNKSKAIVANIDTKRLETAFTKDHH